MIKKMIRIIKKALVTTEPGTEVVDILSFILPLLDEMERDCSYIPLDDARQNIKDALMNIADFCIHDEDDMMRFDDFADEILEEFDDVRKRINED